MNTKSRYDFMTEGVVKDEITNNLYPDPLSINYFNFKLSSLPRKLIMEDSKINFLWNEMYKMYGAPAWDDVILNLNGISHSNFLKAGDILYFPEIGDIMNSFNKD